jgi:hypothetical protein
MSQYIPITLLEVKHPYKIEGVCDEDGMIMLRLRGYEKDAQEFRTFLPMRYHETFRRIVSWNLEDNNGEMAPKKLEYYGSIGDKPVIKISGRSLLALLW